MDKQTNNLGAQINRAERNWYLGARVSQLHPLIGLNLFYRGRTWGDNVKEKMAASDRGCSIALIKP